MKEERRDARMNRGVSLWFHEGNSNRTSMSVGR